ncbi:n-6 adenine-specific dna methyltransferase 1 [Nannochloropsis gaditana]|uniref:N-6 adenine-specific dna methyltransferase 1 n=1 Tax=Nannochloropsis gaditana TaxID=72520 RepID=W7U1K3_9STRA|nr:n-6 adenine-specific dna methyltransferase 1 [Nannochloropsis gaditana]
MLRSGSGCVTAVLARTLRDALGPEHCTLFISTDINSRAVRATQATGSANSILHHEILQADLLAPLLPRLLHSVDLLVFNPPYVPTPTSEVGSHGIEASWAGGKDGREVLDRILDSIPNLLRPQGGCMYLVAVNENLPEDICARMREENLQAEVVRSRKARNEVLHVLRFIHA